MGYLLTLSVVGKLIFNCATSVFENKILIIASNAQTKLAEPITTIIGGPDMYIDTGSTINLTCIVKHLPEPPPGIYWTHNGEVGMKLNFWDVFMKIVMSNAKALLTCLMSKDSTRHLNSFMNKSPSKLIKFHPY